MGIRLNLDPQPRWVQVGNGVGIFCAPPTSYLVNVARARAETLLLELVQSGEVVTKLGGRIVDAPDVSTPEGSKGVHDALFALSLAEMVASAWRGVLDADGEQLSFSPALLALLFAEAGVPDQFVANYMHALHEVVTEGNG